MNVGQQRSFSGGNARVSSAAICRPAHPQFVRFAPDATRPAPFVSVWQAGGF
jgi:hypothetical protein